MEVGESHPDGEDGVFLSESLCAGYPVAASPADLSSDPELEAAHDAREDGEEHHFGNGFGRFVHDEAYGATHNNEERDCPDVE